MDLIAEAGLNGMGSLETNLEMIRVARECGSSTVKFQYYNTDLLCSNRNCFESYKLLDKIRIRPQWIPILAKECKRHRIEFLCTAFDIYGADQIEPHVSRFKIASPEAQNLKFLQQVAFFGKPLLISTGKVTDEQLDRIFDTVKAEISLLYCKSLYPAKPADYNLNEIDRLRDRYKCKVGISCHCPGILNVVNAVKLHGAEIIEKHFTLTGDTVDSTVSLFPSDLKKLNEILRRQ